MPLQKKKKPTSHLLPVDLHINKLCFVKRGLNASSKSIDSGLPTQSAQAELGRYFLLYVNFLRIKRQQVGFFKNKASLSSNSFHLSTTPIPM